MPFSHNEQTDRIAEMERCYDRASEVIEELSAALDRFDAIRPDLERLTAYYDSPLWLKDYQDDEAGLIPAQLKRGVLSEDAVFDLLADLQRLKEQVRQLKLTAADDDQDA